MKELGGWSKGGSKIPETALDDKGIERGGKERLEVWKEAFRKLGTDDPNDPDFDRNWARKTENDVRQIEARNRKENEETEEKREMLMMRLKYVMRKRKPIGKNCTRTSHKKRWVKR